MIQKMKKGKVQVGDIYKFAGQRILEMRNMRGYTRETLAELAGISEKFLYEIENGKKGFSAANLYYLSSALEVDVDYILNGNKNASSDQRLVGTLELFAQTQMESLDSILKEIYNLIS